MKKEYPDIVRVYVRSLYPEISDMYKNYLLEGYDETIHLSKFSTAIYWNTKRLDRKRDRIIKALDELKKSNLIIKDFTYAKKIFSFEVEYIPLSPIELARINTPVSEKQNVIEGNHLKRIE